MLPRGTHSWHKFLKPSEINEHLNQHNLTLQQIQGVSYNPLQNKWNLSKNIDVNYIMLATKPPSV